MTKSASDILARLAAGVSSRSSMQALSGTALHTALASLTTEAGKEGMPVKRRAAKRCKRQGQPCQALLSDWCRANTDDIDACLEAVLPCCEFLEACQSGQFIGCLAGFLGTQ